MGKAQANLIAPDYNTKPITFLKNPVVNAISLHNKGANKKRFFLFKSEDSPVDHVSFIIDANGNAVENPDDLDKVMPLLKAGPAEDMWKAAYCIVAVPGEEDFQRDVWQKPEIQDAAHEYLKKSRLINYMHKDFDSVGDLVQSAIAPCDMTIGGEHIPEGTWYIAIEPYPEMKKMIESGDITGVSVQGSSRRESVDPLMVDMAKTTAEMNSGTVDPQYAPAVPARPVTQVPPMNSEDKDMMEVPDDTEGPGITRLQHILGIEETGTFDEATRVAVSEWMTGQGVPGKPTLATIKLILSEGDKSVEAATQQPETQPVQGSDQAAMATPEVQTPPAQEAITKEAVSMWKSRGSIYHYSGDASKTPLWLKDTHANGVTVEFPPGEDGTAETADVSTGEIYKCDNPDTHYEQLAKDYPNYGQAPVADAPYAPADNSIYMGAGTDNVGSNVENMGTQPSDVGPSSTQDELKSVIARALSEGNQLLGQHLSSAYQINSVQDLQNYSFSQDEIWGMVSRFILGREENPVSESAHMQPVHRTDKTVYGEGAGFSVQKNDTLSKDAMFDYKTPTNALPDKEGKPVLSGAIVKLSNGKIAQVSSVDMATGKLVVEILPRTGDQKTTSVVSTSVVCGEPDPANLMGQSSFDTTLNKADFAVGDIVDYNGIVGDVVAVDTDTVTLSHADKKNKEVTKKVLKSDVKSIGKLAKAAIPGTASAGGSMGGQNPKKYGKIRFIVRSFGKWAGGKQRICVARMRSEHPEVFKGNENAGCAWLKDQWMGTTHWRGKHGDHLGKLDKADTPVAEAANSQALDGLHPDTVHMVFVSMCHDMNVDPAEVENQMIDEQSFNEYLDGLLGDDIGLTNEPVNDASNLEATEPDEASPVAKNARTANNKDFMAALTALQLGIADAVDNEDLEKQSSDLDLVMVDFNNWLGKFTEAGHYVDFDEPIDALEKGWLPAGTTKGDLADGDFAWIADNKELPDSSRRKMPYKVHGKVDSGGWRAAWGVANGSMGGMDTAGGPSIKEVKAKLLRDKPKGIEVSTQLKKRLTMDRIEKKCAPKLKKRLEKGMPPALAAALAAKNGGEAAPAADKPAEAGGNLKGATVEADGKKWIVLGQNGTTLSLRSGPDTTTKEVSAVKVTRQPMGKGFGPEGIAGLPGAGDMHGHMHGGEGDAKCPECDAAAAGGAEKCPGCGAMLKAMPPALAAALEAKKKRLGGAPADPAAEGAPAPEAPVADHTHPTESGAHTGPPAPAEAPEDAAAPEAPADAAPADAASPVARLLALARKRKEQAAGGAPAPAMAKSAGTLTASKLERIRETRDFLESVLNFEGGEAPADPAAEVEATVEDAESTPAEVAPAAEAMVGEEVSNNTVENTNNVEKDVDASNSEDMEVQMSDSEITLDQVVDAVNGLGDEVDTILTRLEEFSTLGPKLDHIGDLAKSLDASERIDSLEQAVERLAETVGLLNSTAESVEEIAKRLTSIEGQPGSSTAAPVDQNVQAIAKSATPVEPVLFQRAYGSIF